MGELDKLRHMLRARRRCIVGEERAQLSERAAQSAITFIEEKDAIRSVGVFFSLTEEVDTSFLINYLLKKGYFVYLPVVVDKNLPLHWHRFTTETKLINNKLGIPEPISGRIEDVLCGVPDLTVVPLVGFDCLGNRLGMGGGFYDRTFYNKIAYQPPWLLGLAYACQEVSKLDRRIWDVPMDAIATEKNYLSFNSGSF